MHELAPPRSAYAKIGKTTTDTFLPSLTLQAVAESHRIGCWGCWTCPFSDGITTGRLICLPKDVYRDFSINQRIGNVNVL